MSHQCNGMTQIKIYNHFRSKDIKQVLDFDESSGVINRLVTEEEEDEREDTVDV